MVGRGRERVGRGRRCLRAEEIRRLHAQEFKELFFEPCVRAYQVHGARDGFPVCVFQAGLAGRSSVGALPDWSVGEMLVDWLVLDVDVSDGQLHVALSLRLEDFSRLVNVLSVKEDAID